MGLGDKLASCSGCQHWLNKAQGAGHGSTSKGEDMPAPADVSTADPASDAPDGTAPTATLKTTTNMCGCVSRVDLVFAGFGMGTTAPSEKTGDAPLPLHETVRGAAVRIKERLEKNLFESSSEEAEACAEITKLLDSGRDANEQDEDGVTALSLAAFEGLPDVVVVLVKAGAELDHRTLAGLTPLMLACHQGHAKVAEVLLANGAAGDLCDIEGWSAMMTATSLDCIPCMEVLLQYGADINQPTRNSDHHTPIMVASQNGFVGSVRFLIHKGATLEHKDAEGMSALMRATHENQVTVVKLLLDAGADVEARNSEGMSALMWAAYEGHCQTDDSVGALLLKYGADIGAVDQYGEDALALSQQRGFGPQMHILVTKFGKGKSLFQRLHVRMSPTAKLNEAGESVEVPA